ncbi:MAG: hypothetical protein FRX48_06520 [Lasallia pustulata]|uniref:Amidoligase enzyme n=1 Tax=Lasallia pustulata TaxID=136370 RepID=A0A5M8PKG2_9LECA|nr:MAG: hypothetical protein FRX48_06520 [Lasallia pustulata]
MINEDYEITFGVELELVFGFREGLLRTYLKSIQDSSQIVKGISEGDRVTMASHLNSGVDEATLLAKLRPRIGTVGHWDSHGIELVSPVFGFTPTVFDELSDLLTRLKGTDADDHGALITDNCGLHIHVGLPPTPGTSNFQNPRFDLPTLQHLAYLLVMYEPHISTLHPPSRRAGSPASTIDLQTNLTKLPRPGPETPLPNHGLGALVLRTRPRLPAPPAPARGRPRQDLAQRHDAVAAGEPDGQGQGPPGQLDGPAPGGGRGAADGGVPAA